MKISVNWLKDYVNLDGISTAEIADKLTQITCEVEACEHKGSNLNSVVAGKVLTCEAHPKSGHLRLLTVDIGKLKPLHIVCGAANARAGITVAVATVGTKLPNGLEIQRSEIRGEESRGMCCSGAELEISADNDGILELPDTAAAGQPITDVMPEICDDILDIDNKSITNRPDLWGHYGIARELSVIFGRKFKAVKTDSLAEYDDLPKLSIKIENDNCLSYSAMKVADVGGVASPILLQNRLFYCGHSSHGFLVDITNYVMLCFGNPVHAFDARTVGKISVGGIPAGQKFTTLKDNEIIADKDMLFIKSDGRPVALAGIMGGKNSEIKPDTKDAVFEVATFDSSCIRRTGVKVGIRSDASMRYEKALDPETNFLAMSEILRLIAKYEKDAKILSAFTRVVGRKAEIPVTKITLKKSYLENFVGVSFNTKPTDKNRRAFDYKAMTKVLSGLGFSPKITKEEISVTVPSYRMWKDISTKADICEEIIRFYGYNNIAALAPAVPIKPIVKDKNAAAIDTIKNLLANKFGFSEVHTNIWYDTKAAKALNVDLVSHLTVINSFNKNDDKIRSEILTSMLSAVLINKTQKEIRLFEIGSAVPALKDNLAAEEKHLGIVAANYEKLAAYVKDIFNILGCELSYKVGECKNIKFHPKNNAVIFIQGAAVGEIGVIHPKILAGYAGCEINLSACDFNAIKTCIAPTLSKFPKTEFDFTFIWNGIYADLENIFAAYKNPYIMGYALKDIYNESKNENKYTITVTIGSYEKTLTGGEISAQHKEIIKYAEQNGVKLAIMQ
jgi:phenylalanyl-tRNA synthetase beta chain